MADFDLNPDPMSTWGASRDYIEAWNAKFGNGGGVSAPVADPVEEDLARPTAFEGLDDALKVQDLNS